MRVVAQTNDRRIAALEGILSDGTQGDPILLSYAAGAMVRVCACALENESVQEGHQATILIADVAETLSAVQVIVGEITDSLEVAEKDKNS